MIDILIPVLARPQNVVPLMDSIKAHTTVDHTVTFIVTLHDDEQGRACREDGRADNLIVHLRRRDVVQGEYAAKINSAFRATDSEFVFNGADDIEFTPGWDTTALAKMRGQVGVVATNDKANRQVMRGEFGTHCLISRNYIDTVGGTFDGTPGVVLHEGYDHNFVDRELCDAAKRRRRFAFASQSVVRHHHPLWKTAAWDPTYRKALARFREDQRLFSERSSAAKRTRKRDSISR